LFDSFGVFTVIGTSMLSVSRSWTERFAVQNRRQRLDGLVAS